MDEEAQRHTAPPTAGWMLVRLYQADGILAPMFNKHDAYMLSDFNERNSGEKHDNLKRRVAEISDYYGGCLLLDQFLCSYLRYTTSGTQSEYSEAHACVQGMSIWERGNVLHQRVHQWSE